MKKRNVLLTLLLLMTITFCAENSNAQTVTIKEKLPNGELIIEVDGVEQRTINASHAREIESRKIALDAMTAENALLKEKVSSLESIIILNARRAELDTREIALVRSERDSYKDLFEGEKTLRLKSEKLQGGRVSGFFNHPVSQVIFKVVVPIGAAIISRH